MWSLNKTAPAWLAPHFKPGHQLVRLYECETAGGNSSTCTCPWCWHQADLFNFFFIWVPQFLIYYWFHQNFHVLFFFPLSVRSKEERKTHNICYVNSKINKILISSTLSRQRMDEYLVLGPLAMATKWNLKFWRHSEIKASKEHVNNSHRVFTKATFEEQRLCASLIHVFKNVHVCSAFNLFSFCIVLRGV